MEQRISFHDQISKNKRNSIFLMIAIFLVLCLVVYIIGMIYLDYFFLIMIIGIIISISYILFGYYNSDKIALASVRAVPADRERFSQYYHIVEGLTLASGLPMPKLYIMQSDQINAFATGRDPQHAVICVTTGCLEKLNKQELEGVMGHELSHIANYDIRFMTLVAVMVGMISIISELFLRSLWFRGRDERNNKGNAILLIIGIVLAILAPITVKLVQLAISRKREFVADASAVKFIRSPTGLINALTKIKDDVVSEAEKRKITHAVAPLFISDPFKSKIKNMFSTHPSLDERIRILKSL